MIHFLYILTAVLSVCTCTDIQQYISPSIWPAPTHITYGQSTIYISSQLHFITQSADDDDIKTLSKAYDRYTSLIFIHTYSDIEHTVTPLINKVMVTVYNESEIYPQLNTNESYSLIISTNDTIHLVAETVYGALRGLETLSQLILYNYDTGVYYIDSVPITIQDTPRYPHRGLLLDTSRHYQPIAEIERTIDALSYAKFNVLHWHAVDTQSFPFQSLSYPDLWKGAYTPVERYRHDDIASLVEYGRERGVRVMIEFDVPGHAASWCAGYPEICPSNICLQPLDPSNELTFDVIDGLLGECTGRAAGEGTFPYSLIHLGGDEVDYTCWTVSEHIQEWAKKQGLESNEDIYKYFLDRAASIAREQGRIPVQWVEVFEHFGSALDNDTLVHVWKDKSTLDDVLTAGYKALLSNQALWYLDHLDTTWEDMYTNEPTDDLSPTSDPTLILGGEACMWGETVDPSDLDATIWPRAAAVAERLWSPKDQTDIESAEDRLQTFRCLLAERGIAAAPVLNNKARSSPPNPGSCYAQRRLRIN
mmetsp:Transcript_14346/g.21493  ORF Transcript_14346/g.21493 Transcript_14346/m.21493 type:complete len:534 (+) Transcript_14346:82-1683(+)